MKKISYLFPLFLLLFSCKKEKEYPMSEIPNCKLCAWAKSVEGKYIGIPTGVEIAPTGMGYYNSSGLNDSLIIDVNQVWKENYSPSNDSTIMVFKLTYTMKSDTTKHSFREIYFNTSDGKSIQSNINRFDIFEYNSFKSYYFLKGKFEVLVFQFRGIKIE